MILIFAGIILGTLGTWSIPLGHGISAFWPAFVVQVAGSVWFGGWGVLAAILFPILTNTFANVGLSGMLGFIPANLAQGLIPAWAFRHFRVDPAIPGNKGLVFYMIWGAVIPATVGGLLGSVAVILFGEASWSDYPLLVVKWATPHILVSLLIGVPIMRELTSVWRDLGLLVTGPWAFEQASDQAAPRPFRDIPIQLKLALAMVGAGLGPLLLLSLLELTRDNGYSMPGNMMPLFLSLSLVALVLAVGFLSRQTVRPLQELQEQVESLVQYREGVLTVERADEIGQLGQAFAFLLDDRRRAKASLQESEEKYRTLVENINVGIFQSTLDGRFLHANSAVIHMAGYDRWDEFKELPASSLYADETDRERLLAELKAQGRVWNVETRSRKKDGTLYWIAISAILLKDHEGKPTSILGSVVDITKRRQAEVERENLITELSTKNAELERFTYTVSHDLKSPIVTIRGFLGYLAEDALSGNTSRMKKDIERITNATEKMQSLLHDLLELSRIGRMMNAPETIQMEDLIHDALDILHGQLEERHITVLAQPDLPAVYGDRQRLTEVLQNLIDNAIKYMGDQTEPYIEMGQSGEESGRSIFFVKDNGIGIAPEYRERIFGLFNKLDPSSEGTGIGLALVKRIIEVHGGRIWVEESGPGIGSTFCFSLPKH
jgi:PAS domain S-box-containing protein